MEIKTEPEPDAISYRSTKSISTMKPHKNPNKPKVDEHIRQMIHQQLQELNDERFRRKSPDRESKPVRKRQSERPERPLRKKHKIDNEVEVILPEKDKPNPMVENHPSVINFELPLDAYDRETLLKDWARIKDRLMDVLNEELEKVKQMEAEDDDLVLVKQEFDTVDLTEDEKTLPVFVTSDDSSKYSICFIKPNPNLKIDEIVTKGRANLKRLLKKNQSKDAKPSLNPEIVMKGRANLKKLLEKNRSIKSEDECCGKPGLNPDIITRGRANLKRLLEKNR